MSEWTPTMWVLAFGLFWIVLCWAMEQLGTQPSDRFQTLHRLDEITGPTSQVIVKGTVKPEGNRWRWEAKVVVKDPEKRTKPSVGSISGTTKTQGAADQKIREATDQVRRYMAELNDVRSRTHTEEYPV